MATIGESPLCIRPAGVADMSVVAAIFAHYVEETAISFELDPPSVADWSEKRSDLEALGWPFLVAVLNGHVIGYAYVAAWRHKPAYRRTVESTIYLAPGHTGLGYGQRLLTELLTSAHDAGARQVIAVIADTGSPASVALHRGRGFREVGRLCDVGFKAEQWLDVVLMQFSVGNPPA